MASTATTLRTVPTERPVPTSAPPAGAAVHPAAARGVARRGNHPAGRSLALSVDEPAGSVAPVVPLRRTGAVVVPLRRAAPSAAPAVGVPEPVRSAEERAALRLTRRGRLLLSGLGVVTALGVAAFVGPALAGGGAADPALELAGRSTVVVHSGDTLWSIAEAVAPDTDPRAVVDAIQEANGLSGARLVPGQVLVLP